jgi:hypothetical protein
MAAPPAPLDASEQPSHHSLVHELPSGMAMFLFEARRGPTDDEMYELALAQASSASVPT